MSQHLVSIRERANFGVLRAFSWRWECTCGLTGPWTVARNKAEREGEDHVSHHD